MISSPEEYTPLFESSFMIFSCGEQLKKVSKCVSVCSHFVQFGAFKPDMRKHPDVQTLSEEIFED